MFSNNDLIKMAVNLTTAKLSSSTAEASLNEGIHTAEFMQKVYDKLSELNKKEED